MNGRKKPTVDPDDPAQRRLRVFSAPRVGELSRRVTITLGTAGRVGLTAKEVAVAVGAPLRTVYRALDRLVESSIVERTNLGTFALSPVRADITTDPTAVLGFENLHFTVSKWQTEPPPPCRTAKKWHTEGTGDGPGRETVELAWEGRRVRLTVPVGGGDLEGWVASRGTPIPVHKAPELVGWLSAMLGLGRGEEARVTQIEVNSTHESFRAEGFSYLELRRFGEFSVVLYQKAAGLKHEVRLYRPLDGDGTALTLERAAEILVESSPYRTLLRLTEKELELERLRASRVAEERATSNGQVRRDPGDVEPGAALREGFG